jgi:glycine/D-amino acid oxidase-like deaminating enzyme
VERVEVAVIGGGPAGLGVAWELSAAGIDNAVLERGRVGQAWRDRWDSFRLVTPNWSVQLPGHPYAGADGDGFMPRDEVVRFLENYAEGQPADIREGVDVATVESSPDGVLVLRTSAGDLSAAAVVVATGTYRRPHRPPAAGALPDGLAQLDVADYRNEQELPPGAVLVVGSGQSGCQIAEELHDAGRDVVLACGKAPWAPRRVGGMDLVWWAAETGYMDATLESLPSPAARLIANVLVTGHDGGRDLNLRTLRDRGVTLAGRFEGAHGTRAQFASDLAETVAWGDERCGQFVGLIRKVVAERGLDVAEPDPPARFHPSAPEEVDLARFGAVIFAGGFRPDYGALLPWPRAFDELGFPLQRDGESTVVPGLYFMGVHFMRKRQSSILLGMAEDASVVAERIAARLGAPVHG